MRMQDLTEAELGRMFNDVATALRHFFGPETQFALLVFDDPKLAQYVSTCERSCMIEALRETADRLEKRQDVPR